MQGCSITEKMNRSRSVFNSINDIKAHMCTKAKSLPRKVNSHYDTLKVKRDCTQDDIKAAYYDLSKKYHPDRNTSADAKFKFQNVSNAYEVLGNFSKRKQYDRDLAARGDKATSQGNRMTEPEDPMAGFYRSRMSNYDPLKNLNQRTNSSFDFDAWTRAHYGDNFRRNLKSKEDKINREEMRRLYKEQLIIDKKSKEWFLKVLTFVITALMIQSYFVGGDYDRNLIEKKVKANRS